MLANPPTRKLIEKLTQRSVKPIWEMTPDEVRAMLDFNIPMHGKPEPVASVEEKRVNGPNGEIPIRIYTPEGKSPLPALVYFSGNGFIHGSLNLANWLSRALANAANCKVIAVAHRSAPEHKYPAGLNDAFAVTKWVVEHARELAIDPAKIGVAGYSSGGNFAALCAIMARNNNIALKCQLIIAGVLDLSCSSASYEKFAKGYILEDKLMDWYIEQYLPEKANPKDPKISPFWEPNLANLPEALIVTAGCDPLVDENEIYAKRLEQAGIKVKYSCYKGQFHSFLQWRGELQEEPNPVIEIGYELKKIFNLPK